MPDFDRTEYLDRADIFEADQPIDPASELCEFNDDPEDLAVELAETRYALARIEKERERLLVLASKHCDKTHHDWDEILQIGSAVSIAAKDFETWWREVGWKTWQEVDPNGIKARRDAQIEVARRAFNAGRRA